MGARDSCPEVQQARRALRKLLGLCRDCPRISKRFTRCLHCRMHHNRKYPKRKSLKRIAA